MEGLRTRPSYSRNSLSRDFYVTQLKSSFYLSSGLYVKVLFLISSFFLKTLGILVRAPDDLSRHLVFVSVYQNTD